jgi:hypothetical protein
MGGRTGRNLVEMLLPDQIGAGGIDLDILLGI